MAGGTGTRLYPATMSCSKQILTVYDKPMIYYPLSVLMLAGIKEILIISTQRDMRFFQEHFLDGSYLGLNISYAVQQEPKGIAEAFILGKDFIKNDSVSLILGDNIFYGYSLPDIVKEAANLSKGALVFGYHVSDPSEFGVVEFDKDYKVLSIEEKPAKPKSSYAIPGMYFYDNNVVDIASNLAPSNRGELEITDVNIEYLKRGNLQVELLGRGIAWLDTGTPKAILSAANFIETIQSRQGLYVACLEEIAYNQGFIDINMLGKRAEQLIKTEYGLYIKHIAENNK